MLIDPRRRKKSQPTRTQASDARAWQELQRQWDAIPRFSTSEQKRRAKIEPLVYSLPVIDRSNSKPMGFSESAGVGQSPQYTGDYIIGLGQMHKSNMIPITNSGDAIAIGRMRR